MKKSECLLFLLVPCLVAGPVSAREALPPAPPFFCQSLGRPKVLYLAMTAKNKPWADRLAGVSGADVTFVPMLYTDLIYHRLCNKPLEESKTDRAYVNQQGLEYRNRILGKLADFDVVVAQVVPKAARRRAPEQLEAVLKALANYARGGGNLVFINPRWEIVFKGTPLEPIMPMRFDGKHKAWTVSFEGATDHPLTRGLPFDIIGSHWYGPVYVPVNASCVPLTRSSKTANFWYWRLPGRGQVVHLFQDSGANALWRTTSYKTYQANRPDDSEVWDLFHRRLVYWLAYGDRAFPALATIRLPVDAGPQFGQALEVPAEVENRQAKDTDLELELRISVRRSGRNIARKTGLHLAGNEKRTITFQLPPIDLPCTDRFARLELTVKNGQGRVISRSVAWPRYLHSVPLQLETKQDSYAPGVKFSAVAELVGALPANDVAVDFYLVGNQGRALARQKGLPINGEGAPGFSAQFTMPGSGPATASSYWVVAAATGPGTVLGTDWAQVQLEEPWNPRRQFQWSVWSTASKLPVIRLLQDAGFNALGMQGNSYSADRFGLHQYVEGTGINTFGVTIKHDNWQDVREDMVKKIGRVNQRSPDARSKSFVSLGEESGFATGWGRRYYWKEETAPEIPQKVFDQYLSELYRGKIARLNEEWGTKFHTFHEVPLRKSFVRSSGRVFSDAQNWEAMKKKGKAAGIPVELQKVNPEEEYLARSAPYHETHQFFDWYYQKYCDLAAEVFRAMRNSVPRTMMSAPGGFYPKVDVYNFKGQGPFYPKERGLIENAIARRDYGDVPGFSGALWAYFDLRPLWSCTVLSSILAGNSHIDYWVDFPLSFNADRTHSRATFWNKVLTRKLRPVVPILLHKRFAYSEGLGLFIPRQPLPRGLIGKHFHSAIDANAPLYSAMEESGWMPRAVHLRDLENVKVLVASNAETVTAEEGRQMREFVRGGGTLIATPWLAAVTSHGNMHTVFPSGESGLTELLGFRLLNTSQVPGKTELEANFSSRLDLALPLKLTSKGHDRVLDRKDDVEVWTQYADGEPVVLSRPYGRGEVIYLNLVYDWNHWWNSFHEPGRESFRKLIDALLRRGLKRGPEYFLAFESAVPVPDSKGWWGTKMTSQPEQGESVPWWASQLYQDPSGKVKYLAVFSDHRSPKITSQVRWFAPESKAYDLLRGAEVKLEDGVGELALRPGEAALWALVRDPPQRFSIRTPRFVRAGERAEVRLRTAPEGKATFSATVEVFGPDGTLQPKLSYAKVNLPAGTASISIPFAFNDPSGDYRVVATECITRHRAEATIQVRPTRVTSLSVRMLCPFTRRRDDLLAVRPMSSGELLDGLRRLRKIYLGNYAGLEAKYLLSSYLYVPFRPSNRHAVIHRLLQNPWEPHLERVAGAMKAGESFVIAAEDTNRDPLTGQAIDPFARAEPEKFFEALSHLPGATRSDLRGSGHSFKIVRLGKGTFLVSSDSVDRAAYHSEDFIAWHRSWKKVLEEALAGR